MMPNFESPSAALTKERATTSDFHNIVSTWQALIETELGNRLPSSTQPPCRLHEAMRYSTLSGGKRVRAMLSLATAAALGLPESAVLGSACAIEMIHTYSLIHDDLPAMDNDDLRRGRPTCHKAFDEATAILAGDALQVLAFEILARDPTVPCDAAGRLKLITLLAQASGTTGMAGGQALDLAAKGQSLDLTAVIDMHNRKTGALICASVLMAAACAAPLPTAWYAALQQYAEHVGLAFQIQDDLLDIEGDPTRLGKATGADQAGHKPTYPAIAGVAAAHEKLRALHKAAITALEPLQERAALLIEVAAWLARRQS